LCSDAACLAIAYILAGGSGEYTAITPEGGVSVPEGSFEFHDTDEDGNAELLATGGAGGTLDTGPERPGTQVWSWDGSAYALAETIPGESPYFYHRVVDADGLLSSGDYEGAEQAYLAAVDDQTMLLWKADRNERDELEAYALYRAALAHLMGGGDAATATGYLDRAKAYPNTLHAQLAASFLGGYAAKGEVGVGCSAVEDDVRVNEAEYAGFWDYGAANPVFDPALMCPF
jgi:hypothetical protein